MATPAWRRCTCLFAACAADRGIVLRLGRNTGSDFLPADRAVVSVAKVWEMLDEMAASNPAGYRKFLEKQMKEKEKWEAEQKKAHVGVKTGKVRPCETQRGQTLLECLRKTGGGKLATDTRILVPHPPAARAPR